MPKRALVERRPYILASLAAAMAYYLLRNADFPGLYLAVLKGGAVGLLGVYAWLRHHSQDARLLSAMIVAAALAVLFGEFEGQIAGLLQFASYALGLGLFLMPHNRRYKLTQSQRYMAIALFLGTPALLWLLSQGMTGPFYGLGLGAMAAAAWVSRFSRYDVGLGATMLVVSEYLTFAPMSFDLAYVLADYLIWPFYYVGQFLICTGCIQALRRDHRA